MKKQLDNMDQVREAVDALDRQLVPLLLDRLDLMEQAARIKMDRNRVRDEERIEDVVQKVLETGQSSNGQRETLERVYRQLIEACIDHEMTVWDALARNGQK